MTFLLAFNGLCVLFGFVTFLRAGRLDQEAVNVGLTFGLVGLVNLVTIAVAL